MNSRIDIRVSQLIERAAQAKAQAQALRRDHVDLRHELTEIRKDFERARADGTKTDLTLLHRLLDERNSDRYFGAA